MSLTDRGYAQTKREIEAWQQTTLFFRTSLTLVANLSGLSLV